MKNFSMAVLPIVMGVSLPVYAESELGVAISADAVTFNYAHIRDIKGTRWGVTGLYNDSASTSLLAGYFNVMGRADAANEIYTGFGLKAVFYDAAEADVSLALGGNLAFAPSNWSGFGLEGQLYYSPSMLSSGDVEKYMDFVARLTYSVNEQTKLFAGWQNIEVGYENVGPDFEIDNSVHIGFGLKF